MIKIIVALSVFTLAVYCAPLGWKSAEEAKSEMTAAGISSQAADGIIRIAEDYSTLRPSGGGSDRVAARAAFHKFLSALETYIKTQSPADQAAYQSFIANKGTF
uniref:Secreted protein n=1 Tax=Caenorhabditis tropicalis TaxID=1561998 RepID=A0A1I7UWI2_9PELO